jgi:hypothetical protein
LRGCALRARYRFAGASLARGEGAVK